MYVAEKNASPAIGGEDDQYLFENISQLQSTNADLMSKLKTLESRQYEAIQNESIARY